MASSAFTSKSTRFAAVIIAIIASCVLSVDAIRCHQCNSYLDEECNEIHLNRPRATSDDQFLKECEGEHSNIAFCRKTVTTIEYSNEHRVVRGCGWVTDDLKGRNDTCFESDNEGFKETLCACFTDGCNAAPRALNTNQWLGVALTAVPVILAAGFRQSV